MKEIQRAGKSITKMRYGFDRSNINSIKSSLGFISPRKKLLSISKKRLERNDTSLRW